MPGVGKPKSVSILSIQLFLFSFFEYLLELLFRLRSDCKLNIHELRGETYNGLVRLLKPGCRTIVLLCDTASKPKLLPQFYRAVYPYRKYE